MKYTKLVLRASRRTGGNKRSFDEDSDRSDQSSDSGLELDHQAEVELATRDTTGKRVPYSFEEDSNAEYCFPSRMPGRGRGMASPPPAPLTAQLNITSRDGRASLTIVSQPEQQHRARYQTEGSRGAVKDRTGNGFPVVKLTGYDSPTTLQMFVGTDVGRVAPHMFYQACRVSGKNSTPCVERKLEGTVVIEVDLDPAKEMLVTCDCVGILKERNVDVEHRFPEQTANRNKKKSTRCRMVFRTVVHNSDGSMETLQVCSQPIVCTQPPGVPEICKRSLTTCPATGGKELFILGKNFLKDTRVVFHNGDAHSPWEESVVPDKDFLQHNHLVCVVPPYRNRDIANSVNVKLYVMSSGKASDPHTFTYVPTGTISTPMDTQPSTSACFTPAPPAFFNGAQIVPNDGVSPIWRPEAEDDASMMADQAIMPPPMMAFRRPSLLPDELKTEMMDEMSQSMSVDGESQPPSDICVDLSMKTFQPAPYLKPEPTTFPTLYEHVPQQYVDYSTLRPPPSKIPARESSEETSGHRTRSGSFSHSLQEKMESITRARSASVSHPTLPKPTIFGPTTPIVPFSSSLPNKYLDSAMSAKSQEVELTKPIVLAAPVPVSSDTTPARILDALVNCAAEAHMQQITSPLSDHVPITVTQMSYHMKNSPPSYPATPESSDTFTQSPPEFFPPPTEPSYAQPNVAEMYSTTPAAPFAFPSAIPPVIFPPQAASMEVYPQPTPSVVFPPQSAATDGFPLAPPTVVFPPQSGSAEVFPPGMSAPMYAVPSGHAPPITGMVSQEMVKMTENDLISYINPNAFDQGIDYFHFYDMEC